jgi:hypothetical protein
VLIRGLLMFLNGKQVPDLTFGGGIKLNWQSPLRTKLQETIVALE